MNADIRKFSQDIINYMNSNPLPIEVKRLVLVEILQQTTNEATKVVLAEMNANKDERGNE